MNDRIVLYKCLYGSKLYGTDGPESDTDYKLIYLPSAEDILLGKTLTSGSKSTSDSNIKNSKEDVDTESMSFQKFINLLKKGEQNSLDILFSFTNKECVVESHPLWDDVIDNIDMLVSKNIKGAIGFIRSQTNRFIVRGDRMNSVEAILSVLTSLPKEEKVVLYLDKIKDVMSDKPFFEITEDSNGSKHISVCERKVPLGIKIKDACAIYKKLYDEYGSRTKAAKNTSGQDLKGISHAIRIATEVCELLETGKISFPVLNNNYIKDVKFGKVDASDYGPHLDNLLLRCDELLKTSKLKEKLDNKLLDRLVVEFHKYQLGL